MNKVVKLSRREISNKAFQFRFIFFYKKTASRDSTRRLKFQKYSNLFNFDKLRDSDLEFHTFREGYITLDFFPNVNGGVRYFLELKY